MVLMMIVAAGCLAAQAGELARHSIRELSCLGDWGAAATEGDRAYRTTVSNKPARVRMPVWWGEGVRPPEGRVYVVEVTYKDVAGAPVVCEGFGALGRYFSRSEWHRFGGDNDGQWKVAAVPVSWDLVRVPRDARVVELSFTAQAAVPIASIAVRDAKLPEDQTRWEAETRQWIRKAQAHRTLEPAVKRADASTIAWAGPETLYYLEETPELQGSWVSRPAVPFVRRSYENIGAFSAPKSAEVGTAVTLRMARNEIESGTFGIYAQQDLSELQFTVSDLTGPSGKLACEIQAKTLEYSMGWGGGKFWRTPIRWWSMYPVDVKQGYSQWFCANVRTLGEASQPGVYDGKITVSGRGLPAFEIPLKVEVLPILLQTMDEAGLRMGGCVSGLPTYGEMKTMAAYNHNMINLWVSGACPEMSLKDGKLALDFTYLDDWMALARKAGIRTIVWFLGGNPNGFPRTLTLERELFGLDGKKDEFYKRMSAPEQRGSMLPVVQERYAQWIAQVARHAREQQWPELIFTPFDEPAKWVSAPKPEQPGDVGCGVWIRDHFKVGCKVIHEAAPGAKVYISMHHNNTRPNIKGRIGEIFIEDVDVVCSNAIHEDPELGNKVRAAGREFWQYTSARGKRYSFGFYFGAYDSRGSLAWAYNFNGHFSPPYDTYASYSPFATVTTPTYEELREGWDDRRYLETLKSLAKARGKDETAFFARLRERSLQALGGGSRDTVSAFWESSRNPRELDDLRGMIVDEIIKLKPGNR
jgi:hypothetical protein